MTMRKIALALVSLTFASTLAAQSSDAALRNYVTRAMPRCAGATLEMEPVAQQGPTGFQIYRATLNSTDQYCGANKYFLYSPATQQTIMGTVIALPKDTRPVHVRVAEQAGKLLKTTITATIAPLALPDGLRQVTMTRQTKFGPFGYTGYVDGSNNFLVIGLRGNLKEDPGTTLLRNLGVEKSAARRGNSVAKVSIIELSDFQCPTCARAHAKLEPIFTSALNRTSITRIDLPLFEHHEWALPAALGARAIQRVAPAKYWAYVDYVFKNQEQIEDAKFDTVLKAWVEDNDIDWKAIEKIYRSKSEQQAILDSVSRAFAVGINSTPTFIVNGQQVGFGDGTFATDLIKNAIK